MGRRVEVAIRIDAGVTPIVDPAIGAEPIKDGLRPTTLHASAVNQ
jgi:hypothetical protein